MFIWTPASEETSHKNYYVKELGLKKIEWDSSNPFKTGRGYPYRWPKESQKP